MRLKAEQIQKVSALILRKLKNQVTLRVPENQALDKIIEVITGNLHEEDQLENEARKLLDKYRSQIDAGQMDEHKALFMIKKQLAKERKIIL